MYAVGMGIGMHVSKYVCKCLQRMPHCAIRLRPVSVDVRTKP